MHNSPEPDASEKRFRFGCGFVVGGLLAVSVALQVMATRFDSLWVFVAGVAGAAVVCGLLAVRYGDAFWHAVASWFRWW